MIKTKHSTSTQTIVYTRGAGRYTTRRFTSVTDRVEADEGERQQEIGHVDEAGA
jgi:hypothetical protein